MPTRRNFLAGMAGLAAAGATGVSRSLLAANTSDPLANPHPLGTLTLDPAAPILPGGQWYIAQKDNDGLSYTFAPGALLDAKFLTTDLLIDGFFLTVFSLDLQEGEKGPKFRFQFATLGQCQARLQMPADAVTQNTWMFPRQGALLKPMAWDDRVDLKRVDRMTLTVIRKADEPVRFCMTPIRMTDQEPPALTDPLLPKGLLVDELGQTTQRDWPGKTKSVADLAERLKTQLADAPSATWPADFSRFGGRKTATAQTATGFFRTHHDGKRWWLIDPEGLPFWSSGVDCVTSSSTAKVEGIEKAISWLPDSTGEYADAFAKNQSKDFNFFAANLIRALGPQWHRQWGQITVSHLRRFGFNTVGNWSDWHGASAAGFPYVRPIEFIAKHAAYVFRDFPDVFDPAIAADAEIYAQQLTETVADPAMIGYFLMNEPNWAFSTNTPAEGMLFNTDRCACRDELAKFLRQRYTDDAALTAAWQMPVLFAQIRAGRWYGQLSAAAKRDLESFSTIMVDKLFTILTDAARKVDPNHLNLGSRYFTVPPDWALAGMKRFDVFSFNCYAKQVPGKDLEKIAGLLDRPVLVGEWHFGALDVGLPASGIGRVKDQSARGDAFRFYVEQAAALPNCIGVHYFILYDQPTLGRFDGECYNIGFLDTANRPYAELAEAARKTHERLYTVAAGEIPPFNEPPEYLPKLFV
jgi:hypothetical protein